MRAARALDMLLILQRRGRRTARELAEELEVSERTILRDVEVLSEAGVPIYTTQGKLGGIELLDGFETNLTGLTTDEARTLFLVGHPRVAHRLGLGVPVRSGREKLLAAVSPALAAEAETLNEWFLHDPDPWDGHTPPHGELRRIADCIHRRRVIEIVCADNDRVAIRPLGLVLKAGVWHVVHTTAAGIEVLGLAALRSTRKTSRPFPVPDDFDLTGFWKDYLVSLDAHR